MGAEICAQATSFCSTKSFAKIMGFIASVGGGPSNRQGCKCFGFHFIIEKLRGCSMLYCLVNLPGRDRPPRIFSDNSNFTAN
jgi:hypothetical protein